MEIQLFLEGTELVFPSLFIDPHLPPPPHTPTRCHLPAVILRLAALTTIPFPLIKKTDMAHSQHNASPRLPPPFPVLTTSQLPIILIIRPIRAHGWRPARAPANLEAAMTGSWDGDRPETRLTNEQRRCLISPTCV